MDAADASLAHTLTVLLSCGCCGSSFRRRADYEAGPPSPSTALYEAPRPLTTTRRPAAEEGGEEGPAPSSSGRAESAPLLTKHAAPPTAPLPDLALTPTPPMPTPFYSSSPAKPGGGGGAGGAAATTTAGGGAPAPPSRPPISGLSLAGLEEEPDVCEVCLEPYTPEDPRVPLGGACGHGLHLGCTLAWLERGHDTCPLCDGPIDGEAAALLDQ